MSRERKNFLNALFIPLLLVVMMWVIKIVESLFGIDFGFLGTHPLSLNGIQGIITMPFVHGSYSHIFANTVPFIVLGTALFYFYKGISVRVLIGIWILSGIWTWFGGRDSWHVGASGIIYGLSAFLFVSGVIRKDTRLAALSLIVAFLYGSLIWGIIPDFYPEKNISWEGHMGGFVAGIIMAVYYRTSGPQRKKYSWELEEEYEDDEDEDAYWKKPNTNIS
ncbi:MAG: rhomboid family intramembrane serine protease [Marinilabiliales bacterium]|nr:MAG: rhomboid family intramembrane serine protease [Marinilabiliales bacterium]